MKKFKSLSEKNQGGVLLFVTLFGKVALLLLINEFANFINFTI